MTLSDSTSANWFMLCEIYVQFLAHITLGTRGFTRVRREFSVSAFDSRSATQPFLVSSRNAPPH